MAKKSFGKGDIVRVDYKAYFANDNTLYDTTNEAAAKEAGIFNEHYTYAPMPYVVGSGRLFAPLDKAISEAKIGEETTVEIESKDAAGVRDPKLVERFPMKDFLKREIRPYPGLEVTLGERRGTIQTVSAGRVLVDFNNPLAGRDLKYVFTVTETVDGADKASVLIEMDFGTSEGFTVDAQKDKVVVTLPDIAKYHPEWPKAKFRIVSDLRDAYSVDTVEFVEIWSKAPAEDAKKDDEEKE